MPQRRRGTYVRAYAFGADSTITLSSAPTGDVELGKAFSERLERRAERCYTQPRRRERGVVSGWVLVLAIAVVFFALGMTCVSRCATGASLNKQLYRMREELARATQTNEALEVRIAEKADDTRIQTLALNHLGMKQATSDRIYTVEPVAVPVREETSEQTIVQPENVSGGGIFDLFGIFLHRIGL